jgi:thiol-disulfide isomerase/thioredoxin/adenylate kinase family enzyme
MRLVGFLIFLLIVYQSLAEDGYKIKVKIKGLKEKDTLILGHHFADKMYADDTALVDKNGWANFIGKKKLDGGIYVVIVTPMKRRYFEFLMDNIQNMTLETDTTDFIKNMKVSGSNENKIFFEWQKTMIELDKQMKPIQDKIKQFKDNNKDSSEYYKNKAIEIDNKRKEYWKNTIKNHPDALLSKILKVLTPIEIPEFNLPENTPKRDSLIKLYQYVYHKDHYWDNVDFSDDRLLRTPFIHQKLQDFYKNIVVMHPDSLTKEAVKVIELARKNKYFFQYVVVFSVNYFETSQIMGMDRIFVNLAEKYYLKGECWWADSTLINKISDRVKKLKPNLIGEIAPDLKMEDINGMWHQLKYIKADFIIVAFWEPSCGHCKKEIPKLYEYYKTVRDSGVVVFAVYTQHDEEEWKKFIEEKQLYDWINVWDKYNFTNFRNLYDIYSTPVIYILDRNKKIIAKRIGVEQIEKFIQHYRKTNYKS